ncbi:MAG TPA: prepilin-type N-terminal cleavage/methylation domain-containing protein [Candidatus Sumerlaeota bacterium]|nr:prepilin-type N-terminal cleavage/methylation domain-containing protein [Candidatus Sumerlaeota bacterium]
MKDQKENPGSWRPGHPLRRKKSGGGFTLIELLIVVAIIAILAAIAVPNFLEAQTRAKVSRVKADARSLATAIETYRLDWNRYAPRSKFPAPLGGALFGVGDVLNRSAGTELGRYTSPIAYMSSLPVDVFEHKVRAPNNLLDVYPPNLVEHLRDSRGLVPPPYTYNPFDTASGYTYGYLILSVGPDGLFGSPQVNLGNYPAQSATITWHREYDPTNGTVSAGNVYRFSSGVIADVAFN